MRSTVWAIAATIAMTLAPAVPAGADTFAPRDTAFPPGQAVADQYSTAPTPSVPLAAVAAAATAGCSTDARPAQRGCPERGVAGDEASGPAVAGDQAEGLAVAGDQAVAPAVVDGATSRPRGGDGSLPFTGADIGTLVWLALALLAAGALAEAVRRRLGEV